jgi:hypothetical protein
MVGKLGGHGPPTEIQQPAEGVVVNRRVARVRFQNRFKLHGSNFIIVVGETAHSQNPNEKRARVQRTLFRQTQALAYFAPSREM